MKCEYFLLCTNPASHLLKMQIPRPNFANPWEVPICPACRAKYIKWGGKASEFRKIKR